MIITPKGNTMYILGTGDVSSGSIELKSLKDKSGVVLIVDSSRDYTVVNGV